MENEEFCSVIKYYFLREKDADEIKATLDEHFGKSAPSLAIIENCIEKSEKTLEEKATKEIHDMVLDDQRLTENDIYQILKQRYRNHESFVTKIGFSVEEILEENLQMKKLFTRWVPKLLSIDQKHERVRVSKLCLELCENIGSWKFDRRYVSVNEMWIHYDIPDNNYSRRAYEKPRKSVGGRRPPTCKLEKIMVTVFWDAQGIIFINYLESGKTMTAKQYALLLDRLNNEIKSKRPRFAKEKILLHQENTPIHTSAIVMEKLNELGYELIPYTQYSPDLSPFDFSLLSNIGERSTQKWKWYEELEADTLIAVIDAYFYGLNKSYFEEGIKNLKDRWAKCIELDGDYIEETIVVSENSRKRKN